MLLGISGPGLGGEPGFGELVPWACVASGVGEAVGWLAKGGCGLGLGLGGGAGGGEGDA